MRHVLMISLSDGILSGWGSVQERHLDYARHVEHLHIIAYSPAANGYDITKLGHNLTVYPTRSGSRLHFLPDALRIGRELLTTYPVDVVTTQDPFMTGLVGVLLTQGKRVGLHVQNHSDVFGNPFWLRARLLNRVLHILGLWVIRRADINRVVNAAEREKYIHMGISPESVYVSPVPVMFGNFQPEAPPDEAEAVRQELAVPAGSPMILWVGRPVAIKRVPMLIEAVAYVRETHPDVVLVLVGDTTEAIREAIDHHDMTESVRLPGRIANSRLPALYRTCAAYAQSSDFEGSPLVLIEAAACGAPIVSTATAGGREIVRDGETGFLCPIGNTQALAEAVVTLLDDPQQAKVMGRAGSEFVRHKFDYAKAVESIIATWQAAVPS